MERLKKILRLALQEQAQRLKLQAGAPLELLLTGGPRQVPDEGPVDAEYVQRMFAFLFPNDRTAIGAGQITKGMLTVPNVGRLLLIAQPSGHVSLRIYLPPNGQALFDSDWVRLAGGANDAGPQGIAAPAPGPGAPLGMPGLAPLPRGAPGGGVPGAIPPGMLFGNGGGAPLSASPGAAPPAGAFPSASPPPGRFSGFIPPGHAPEAATHMPMAVSAPLMEAPVSQPLPLLQTNPSQVSGVPSDPPPALQPPALFAMPAQPAPPPSLRAERAPEKLAERPPERTQPTSQPIATGGGADERPVIIFGPDIYGGSDVSDGRNTIDQVLTHMVKRKASDLHMTCGEPLCFRLDGEIERITTEPTTPDMVERFLLPIMPMRNQIEFAKIHDTDFAYEIRGVGRFRVNVFRDKNGVGSVMRHIPSTILTAEQLGLPPAITKFCQLTKGLVVVTGPTGSGKSTTLAAMVDLINKTRHDHILTIEDPVEFVHPQQKCLVNQREVHKHTGSFARALKAALREDPDIVLIGEMRDLETVAIAIETAETGHLVFGTLHTNTAVSTIDRIVDQFPTDRQEQIRTMLASSLKGVVAQTLLKKKGGGRCAAHEILVTNDAVAAMIREGKIHMIGNHMQTQKSDGNVLLNESLLRLVKDGLVDAEDAIRKAIDKVALIDMMKRYGVRTPDETQAPAPKAAPPAKRAG